jgi:hypothetical protein
VVDLAQGRVFRILPDGGDIDLLTEYDRAADDLSRTVKITEETVHRRRPRNLPYSLKPATLTTPAKQFFVNGRVGASAASDRGNSNTLKKSSVGRPMPAAHIAISQSGTESKTILSTSR